MYSNILIPIAPDHGDMSEALEIARAVAAEGAKLTALTVVDALPEYVASYLPEGQMTKTRDAVLDRLRSDMTDASDVNPVVLSGHSYSTILEYAGKHDIDCIVITSHRPGLQDYLLGSTAARVVRHAQCAVHVVR